MDTTELIKKVRKIEIRTRGLTRQMFTGSYHSAFKGKGMAFSEVREYQPGDDIRSIDWNVTARLNHPFVKVYEEERELTVILLIDASGSESFGTKTQFKRDLITELSAVIAFSATQNNDKIGVIFFSDKVEKFIPPKKGRTHTLRIIRELLEFQPQSKATDIGEALRFLTSAIKKKSIVFVMSDFLTSKFDDAIRIASKKHDTIAVRIYDEREEELPDLGMVRLIDSETGAAKWIDSSSRYVRDTYKRWWLGRQSELNDIFMRSGVDVVKIRTDESYIAPLRNFFKKRGIRR